MNRQSRGAAAEAQACRFLEARGLRTLGRNYRCRWGEIDLIMRDAAVLVFVEVRYRRHAGFGGALGSIDRRKRERLARAASHYLQRNAAAETPARFDVVTVSPIAGGSEQIEWLANAFEAGP